MNSKVISINYHWRFIENDCEQFDEAFRLKYSLHIQEKYAKLTNEFENNFKRFQFLRENLTEKRIEDLDHELMKLIDTLPTIFDQFYEANLTKFYSESIKLMKRIEYLILNDGANVNYNENVFHFGMLINKWFISKGNLTLSDNPKFLKSLMKMCKAIFISNPFLLQIQEYTNTYAKIYSPYYFLSYSIYQLNYFPDARYEPNHHLRINWYKVEINLFLFILNHLYNERFSLEDCLFDILHKIKPSFADQMFIRICQLEILRILLEKYENDFLRCDKENRFAIILENLFKTNQIDVIKLIYKQNKTIRYLFDKLENIEHIVDIMIANQKMKQSCEILFNDQQLRVWFINKKLLFILLKKKQCKLIKHLFKLSSSIIHQLDEDGNDSLLYICLNVRGCRHRLIEFLIQNGSDLSRRNFKHINFFNALHISTNRKLLNKLIDHEIISIDYISKEVKQFNNDISNESIRPSES
ncbi:unnamed protein product [Adineta ricciae]|uniref:Ankyrin repeat protein n=1 Tax=Adineta ricciae TaxID=249248 RepID=A0A815JE20_ADIRI|nr:unnamed protein product [Adineta ricciae]CAF1580622.1 unnamed protein product [Adineta ricciae]